MTDFNTLYHGSYSTAAPKIQIGYVGDVPSNIFDGIFASSYYGVADSHGEHVYAYDVNDENIANSQNLSSEYKKVYAFLMKELNIANVDDVEEIADRVIWDNCSDIDEFADLLTRAEGKDTGSLSWELQRLRGRVAASLGYDAVEMDDEHGTSYLIVNPDIKGRAVSEDDYRY